MADKISHFCAEVLPLLKQMARPKLKGLDMTTLERLVKDNAKQRFTMREEPTGVDGIPELWVRANQGHSVIVRLFFFERFVFVQGLRLLWLIG